MFKKIILTAQIFRIMVKLYAVDRKHHSESWSYGMWDKKHENFYVLHDDVLYSKPASDVYPLEVWPTFIPRFPDVCMVYKPAASFA